jgi:hypothetical protein
LTVLDSIVYQPPALYRPGEITITPWSMQSLGVGLYTTGQGVVASQNFVTASLAVFVPFYVPEPVTITKLFWSNGAAVAGNLDAGIYNEAGTRIVSTGTTAQATINVVQSADVTDTGLARGVYYLAFASDTSGVTQKVMAVLPAAGIAQSLGLLQMAAAFVLPATATFAKYASAFVPMVGAQGYRAIGP